MEKRMISRRTFKEACAQWIEAIIEKGLSASQIAERMGCRRSAISKMQNRRSTRIPKTYELINYSTQSGIPIDTIMSEIYGFMRKADAEGPEEEEVPRPNRYADIFMKQPEREQRMLIQILNIIKNKDLD